jgi:quercetin dioxygenase-like cupin family protein
VRSWPHDHFDEAIYVLRGRLLVTGDGEPQEAAATRGRRRASWAASP